MNSPWAAVIQLIEQKSGHRITDYKLGEVYGGDINQAWRLTTAERDYFIKTNRKSLISMFEAEQIGLQEIHRSRSIRVPGVIGCGWEANQSFIVMEFLDLTGMTDETRLARKLAKMHRFTRDEFGFRIDNTIGSTPQINTDCENWVEFWQRRRLGYQLNLAGKNSLDSEMISRGEILCCDVGKFFSSYKPIASLLHGDLWRGNQGADREGNPVIFDPACYYGDHEADLAMMELFGQPGRGFFDAYSEVFEIDPGYPVRRDLYNLYHILNHANLFGGHYAGSARKLIEKLLAEI